MTNIKYLPKISGELKIICPFCNAPYTADMNTNYERLSSGCDTCGYGAEHTENIEIKCNNCHRLVYTKRQTKRG